MADPFVAEIRIFPFNFAPRGWAWCDGQLLPLSQNTALFSLLGTTYGGDGKSNFALPDLRGRVPIHQGDGFMLAEAGGVEDVTLTTQQIPMHSHPLLASAAAGSAPGPAGNVLAASGSANVYRPAPASAAMAPQSVAATGGSQPHTNMQPYLCLSHIISLFGIFPSPT